MDIFLFWILCAVAAGMLGARKGQPLAAFFVGLILGPFGVLFAALSKGDRRTCPSCRELVHPAATRCPHCQEAMRSNPHGARVSYFGPILVLVFVAAVVVFVVARDRAAGKPHVLPPSRPVEALTDTEKAPPARRSIHRGRTVGEKRNVSAAAAVTVSDVNTTSPAPPILTPAESPVYVGSGAREWTHIDGRKVRARIVSATGTHVVFARMDDQREFTFPLQSLSEVDVDYVKQWRTYQAWLSGRVAPGE